MCKTILFSLICIWAWGQTREEKPLPIFREEPLNVLKEGITGWSYSIDGQWIGKESVIPVVAVSTKKKAYKAKEARVGLDNIQALYLVPAQYGKDTLVALLKLYLHGSYRYPLTHKGWQEIPYAYYFLFKKKELKKLQAFQDTNISHVRIPLLDGGLLKDVKAKDVIAKMNANVVVRRRYDRQLVFTMLSEPTSGKLYFQLYSMHDIFSDVEGVYQDFTKRGRTLYNSQDLLNYLYFEIDQSAFRQFFKLEGTLFQTE